MADKFKNKYRIPSARLQSWDYGSNGYYFVTICTKKRKHFFGEIEEKKMNLNWVGEIALECWIEIPQHFNFVELGRYVVMPNHVHGIIIINKLGNNNIDQIHSDRFRNQGKNTISSIVGSYKSAVTKLINRESNSENKKMEESFGWQSRFYDHIIRSESEYIRISEYIENNPLYWKEDKFYR